MLNRDSLGNLVILACNSCAYVLAYGEGGEDSIKDVEKFIAEHELAGMHIASGGERCDLETMEHTWCEPDENMCSASKYCDVCGSLDLDGGLGKFTAFED